MIDFFRKSRIRRLSELAGGYVALHYIMPSQTQADSQSSIKFSEEIKPDKDKKIVRDGDSEIRYSLSVSPNVAPKDKDVVQYSCRDNYNSRSIDQAVRGLSAADSPAKVLQSLEANTDMSFVDKMLDYIDSRHLRDSDVYKAAQIDRRLFSKIVSDRTYKPAKDTCIALSLALRLTLSEANDILSRAGYVLSHSSKRDVVIEFFFRESVYNLNDVNEILFLLDQKLLGR